MEDKNSLDLLLNNLFPSNNTKTSAEPEDTADKNIYARQINALSAVLPYMNRNFQKNIFLLMKVLEFRKFTEERPAVSMQSHEQPFGFLNTSRMAQDVRKNLNEEEKKVFDTLFRMVMLKNIAGGNNGRI